MAEVKPIPEGYHTITPYITVSDGAGAIEFYQNAFNAEELSRLPAPDGKIMHALMRIGDSFLMLHDEYPDMGAKGPNAIGGSPVTLHLYVPDVDAFFDRAVKAGAKVTMPVQDMFWGDRFGSLEDPYGHKWGIATQIEELTPEQVHERAESAFEQPD